MNNNEHKLVPPEALNDDALDKVTGGTTMSECIDYKRAFMSKNNCGSCNNEGNDNCVMAWLRVEELYNKFGGDPNATCQYFKM